MEEEPLTEVWGPVVRRDTMLPLAGTPETVKQAADQAYAARHAVRSGGELWLDVIEKLKEIDLAVGWASPRLQELLSRTELEYYEAAKGRINRFLGEQTEELNVQRRRY
jgi:hypothetical protein